MAEKGQIVELLKALQSTDNATRQKAETMYQQAKQQGPDQLLLGMMQVLGSADVEEGVRRHDCVLIRQMCMRGAEKDFIFARISQPHQQEVAAELLRRFEQEANPKLQKKIGEVVSMLVNYVCDKEDPRGSLQQGSNGWPTALPLAFKMANVTTSTSPEACESALRLLKDMVPTLKDDIVNAKQELGAILQNGLSAPHVKIKVATVLLVCEIVGETEKKGSWRPPAELQLGEPGALGEAQPVEPRKLKGPKGKTSSSSSLDTARGLWLRCDLRNLKDSIDVLSANLEEQAAIEKAVNLTSLAAAVTCHAVPVPCNCSCECVDASSPAVASRPWPSWLEGAWWVAWLGGGIGLGYFSRGPARAREREEEEEQSQALGPMIFHERLVTGIDQARATGFMVLTPDDDHYYEDYGHAADIREVLVLAGHGDLPAGYHEANFYRFRVAVAAAALRNWVRQANLALAQAPAGIVAGGGGGPVFLPLGGGAPAGGALAAAGVAPLGAPGGGLGALAAALGVPGAPVAVAAPAAAGGLAPTAPPAAPAPLPPPAAVGGGGAGGGLGALAAALGVVPGAGAAAAGSTGGDARTVAISTDTEGNRYREFREGIQLCHETPFADWVLKGPRTTAHVGRFLMQFSTPLLRHTKWKTEVKLPHDHRDVTMHEFLCKAIQVAVVYDQLDISNLACYELIGRELQVLEERYADRILGNDDGDRERSILTSIDMSTTCMAPPLKEFLANEQQKETAWMKERRKAREERVLARGPANKDNKGGKGKKEKAKVTVVAEFCHEGKVRTVRKEHNLEWANDGIQAVNEMYASSSSCASTPAKVSAAQLKACSHIKDSYLNMGSAPERAGALSELCRKGGLYSCASGAHQPYSKDLVSWPPSGFKPMPLHGNLRTADSKWFEGWASHMLRPVKEALQLQEEQELRRPYCDPILANQPTVYADFLRELDSRGLLRWRKARSNEKGLLGIFFVDKKGGRLRLIFDTRVTNTYFKDPVHTSLPTAASFSNLEVDDADDMFLIHADIENAFYGMEVPVDLSAYFTLPPVRSSLVGNPGVLDSEPYNDGDFLMPCLKVLPMGWNWSLAICQSVLEGAIEQAGFGREALIQDKKAASCISVSSPAVAAYVDNFGVICVNESQGINAVNKISNILQQKGLRIHAAEGTTGHNNAADSVDFLGLQFALKRKQLRIKRERLWRLKFAIEDVLSRSRVSGALLECIIGHCTWIALLRRESLSVFSSVYAFCQKHRSTAVELWPSVKKELIWFKSILPLLTVSLSSPWYNTVTASDSSPAGYGVCTRKLSSEKVASIGRVSEKWRFRCEDAINARHRALRPKLFEPESEPCPNAAALCAKLEDQTIFELASATNREFDEVPQDLFVATDWSVDCSRRWKHSENILRTEARVLASGSSLSPCILVMPPRQQANRNPRANQAIVLRDAKKREEALRRRRNALNDQRNLSRGSYLETRSMMATSHHSYRQAVIQFIMWCLAEMCNWETDDQFDSVLTLYLNSLFFDGCNVNAGSLIIASLKFYLPHFSRTGPGHMPRAGRALKGWGKLAPAKMRLPMPRVVMLAICALLLCSSKANLALAIYVSFVCYLRPGEAQRLLVSNLISSSPAAGFNQWGLLLHPTEDLRASKTSQWDEAVLIDQNEWLVPFLAILKNRPADSQLFGILPGELKSAFLEACRVMNLGGLQPCLYQLRHGGASHDCLSRLRPLLEIQRRGRWLTSASLRRYAKETKLLREIASMPAAVVALGSWMSDNLAEAFNNPGCIPRALLEAAQRAIIPR
ncbi:unnamed protein product [Polarella glacialis]|uniref:Reverse transcriptase domain-containing protein n=3 Tax=Polarella glacialis TaxID=89957 RepID=A0A813DQN6_POLGL|nr:unnamed protein product [Polarella glacialis]